MYKRTVKVRFHNPKCDFRNNKFGNWTDLSVNGIRKLHVPSIVVDNEGIKYPSFRYENISLGVSMTLPKHYKAEIKPRSSTYKNFGLLMTCSIGEIEWDYSQEWGFPALAFKEVVIEDGERICQFQIKLREDAPWYMKIADLFRTGFIYKEVDILTTNRGGFGSTGTKKNIITNSIFKNTGDISVGDVIYQ